MDDREDALSKAIAIGGTDVEIVRRAELFYRVLRGSLATRLRLAFGPVLDQTTHTPGTGQILGVSMAQLHDNEQFDVTVSAQDSKGFPVADTFTASIADTTVATVTPGADGQTFTVIAGVPGSTVLTVGDDELLSATLAIDVVAGNVALITLTAGEPTVQVPPTV